MTATPLCDDCSHLVLSDDVIHGSGHVAKVEFWHDQPALRFNPLEKIRQGYGFDIFTGDASPDNCSPEFFYCIPLQHHRHDVFPNFPRLEASAQLGCAFCSTLRSMIQRKIKQAGPIELIENPENDDSSSTTSEEPPKWTDFSKGEEVNLNFGFFLKYYPYIQNIGRKHRTYGPQDNIGLGRLSVLVAKKGNHEIAFKRPWALKDAAFIFGPTHLNFSILVEDRETSVGRYLQIYDVKVHDNPGSGQVMSRALEWITSCISSHRDSCSKDEVGEFFRPENVPTRLLCIEDDKIYLLLPNEQQQLGRLVFPYVAFSYCWGDNVPLKTEKATLSDRINGIALDDLPAVFQDVVKVARAIKIWYIWIDSLCIIQDDAEDWRRESARMAEIYRNAVFTIVSASSGSANEGFLGARPNRITQHEHIKFPFRSTRYPQVSGHYFVQGEDESDDGIGHKPINAIDELAQSRWGTRGWTFQEQYLSRRLVVFGPSMAQFHCREWSLREDCIALQRRELSDSPLYSRDDHAGCVEHEHENRYAVWYNLVSQFSPRNLTYRSDRLPSFQGVAVEMQRHLAQHDARDSYLAGLWSGDLRQGLAWRALRPDKDKPAVPRISGDYIAPSWSWASHFGAVQFSNLSTPGFVIGDIIHATTDLEAESNPLGAVTGGSLVVQGPAAQFASLKDPAITKMYTSDDGLAASLTNKVGLHLDRTAAYEDVQATTQLIWLLPLWAARYFTDRWQVTGLILKQAEQKDKFLRVGIFVGKEIKLENDRIPEAEWPIGTYTII